MKLPLGIIADDYTGALMVACYLEGAGIYAPLVFKAEAVPANAKVVVVGARTRTIPTSDAVAEVAEVADALSAAGVNAFLYKPSAGFDSSPDGNIGQIADYLSDRTGMRPTLMAAGFPEYAITTHQGCLFYRGKLVSESIKRFDPLTPMSDPDLVRFLSRQTRGSIGLLNHLTLKDGLDALPVAAEALAAAGNDTIFFDVSDQDDLNMVAQFAASRDAVFIASDPVAAAYAKILCRDLDLRVPAPTHARGPAAVLSGTVGPVIARQLGCFSQTYPIFQVDITDDREVEALADEAIAWASDHIGVQPFAISTSADPAAVNRAQTQLGALAAARRAEAILSGVAIELHARGVRRFVVAGGETSGSIVASLGVTAVRAFPEGPLGTGFCVTSGEDPISFFLKPGKHGADDILLRALEGMA